MSEAEEDKIPNQDSPNTNGNGNGTGNGNGSNESDPTKIHIERNPAELISGLAGFFKSILSLRDGSYDVKGVIENVREGIVFKGYNVWILMCSIIVASVGLNMDSTAVIIGAMLISPLMGPIRGIGFGVGINDFKLLVESLKNFGITVGIALLTSFLYFLVTPIHESTSELFGRTEPTFLDVMIAFFGGLAGVIAQSKKKADTVIPGVAIATALMPPLCTAGYGLANGEWNYFFGASYLFLLNTLLIAASTYIFIRYLRFPKKEYVTPKIEKRVRAYTLVFIILAVAPSIYMFYRLTKRSIFEGNADAFVEEVIRKTDANIHVTPTYYFDWDDSHIELDITNYYADKYIIEMWQRQLENYELEEVDLRIKQGFDVDTKFEELIAEYDKSNQGANTLASLLSQRENQLLQLQKEMEELKENPIIAPDPIEAKDLLAGWKIDYPEYRFISIDRGFSLNSKNQLDTTYSLIVAFKEEVNEVQKPVLDSKLSRRFKLELKQKANVVQDTVPVIRLDN